MTNIQPIAELVSAIAAVTTVGLASIELYSRSKAKKAEMAMDIYSRYLFVAQQMEYAVENVKMLSQNAVNMSISECKAFAKTHLPDASLVTEVREIEVSSVKNSDFIHEEGKVHSQQIMDFTGKAMNLFVTINTFYTMVVENDTITTEEIAEKAKRVLVMYEQMTEILASAGVLLHKNLRKLSNHSNIYLVALLVLAAVFLGICLFL